MKTDLKSRLQSGETVYGPWCVIPSASVINIVASTGVDFVIIDMEHGPHDFETVENMIRAAEIEGCASLVRVAANEETLILKALDLGTSGVIVPHIETKEDAERAISYTKYYPIGTRGFSPFTRAGGYSLHGVRHHAERQNEATILILLIEGKRGMKNLDEILTIEKLRDKVDGIYIGAYDLSQSLGLPGEVDHPSVKSAMHDMVKKIRGKGLSAGGYVAKDDDDIRWMKDMGMQIITLLPDCTVLYHAFESRYAHLRKGKEVNR